MRSSGFHGRRTCSAVVGMLADRLTRAEQQAPRRCRSHRPSRCQLASSGLFPDGGAGELHRGGAGLLLVTFAEVLLGNAVHRLHRAPMCAIGTCGCRPNRGPLPSGRKRGVSCRPRQAAASPAPFRPEQEPLSPWSDLMLPDLDAEALSLAPHRRAAAVGIRSPSDSPLTRTSGLSPFVHRGS